MNGGAYHVTPIYVCSVSERLADRHWEDTALCTLAYLPIGMLPIGYFLVFNIRGRDFWEMLYLSYGVKTGVISYV